MNAAALIHLKALSKRGLTLGMAQAEEQHEDAPSQCMYIRAISAPQLSHDDACHAVDARVEIWGMVHSSCEQCGACFECLRKAGALDAMSP